MLIVIRNDLCSDLLNVVGVDEHFDEQIVVFHKIL